jgi:formate hydrogenlyase subunit 3/multisubunit Na+/H+ antiporter MnhD subunit
MLTPLLDALILLTLTVPLAGLIGRRIRYEKFSVTIYVTAAFIAVLLMIVLFYPDVLWGNVTLVAYGSSLPPEGVALKVDSLSMYMSLIFLGIGSTAAIFSAQEIGRDNVIGYYTVLSGIITSLIGIVSSGDLFTLFIFWESMCLCY